MPYASRGDLSLYYERPGSGDPPLSSSTVGPATTFFKPSSSTLRLSHAIATFDLRACRRSARPEGGYDISSPADDVAWLCAEIVDSSNDLPRKEGERWQM
jgi:pimeloyl-ACP methyl ester carboxylesterase